MIKVMKWFKGRVVAASMIIFFMMMPLMLHAQAISCDSGKKVCNPLASKGITDLNGFIKILLEGALKIGIPIIALAIIYSGFLFVAARGRSEKLTEAKNALMYTLIGAAVLLGSWAIAKLISETVLGLS